MNSKKETRIPRSVLCHFQQALALALVSILPVAPAFSATYYVATNGSDSSGGATLSSPFRTISKAMNTAVAGDTVLIRGGTYREQVDVTVGGGSAGNYVTV